MNILYLLNASVLGGATFSVLTLAEGVKNANHTPIFVIPNNNSSLENILNQRGVKYYIVPLVEFSYPRAITKKQLIGYPLFCLKKIFQYRRNIKTLEAIVESEKIDIIHTNVGPIKEGHTVAKKLKCPHVWHIREYGDLDFNIRYFPCKKWYNRSFNEDYVITITKALKEYHDLGNCERAFVIYNGVRKRNDVYYSRDKKKYFLCASRISEEKGHLDVLRAFSMFHQQFPDYKLVILGDGDKAYISQLKDFVVANSLEESVDFKGYTSNVSDYMKEAQSLVVASPSEGFGRMTAEALFAGCLVIGRDSAGTKEILDQTGGILFKSVEELYKGMIKSVLLSDEEYYTLMLKAQEIAVNLFSEEQYVDKVLKTYSLAVNTHE